MGMSDKFETAKGKAKGKVEEMKGKAAGKSEEMKGKSKGKAAENEGQAKGADAGNDNMVDKAADFVNRKTDGKYEDKIDTATEKVKKMTGNE